LVLGATMLNRSRFLRIGVDPRRLNRVRYLRKLRILRFYDRPIWWNLGYVLGDCEVDNFTYELENEDELARWLAATFSVDLATVHGLLIEARSNQAIYGRLREATGRRWSTKTEPPLGRRLGWYVIVRLLKPRTIVETGIRDGLGSLVLLAALERNERGRLISTDIDSTAGWIVGAHPRWDRRILNDPAELAGLISDDVDLFLHDSLHTVEHETFELELAARQTTATLVSDNAHCSDVLREVAIRHNREFSYWQERPRAHFYGGGGIGVVLACERPGAVWTSI
jgi:hypothetical protein